MDFAIKLMTISKLILKKINIISISQYPIAF